MEKICGVIEDALIKNNWAKLVLSSSEFPSHIVGNTAVIVGTCFDSPERGQTLEVEGDWDNHFRWGWQFKASTCQAIPITRGKSKEKSEPKKEEPKTEAPKVEESPSNIVIGTIKRAIVKNDWARLALDTDLPSFVTDNDVAIVVGSCFLEPRIGQRLKVHGKWDNHPEWGWQFKATNVEDLPPESEEDIERFLIGMNNVGPSLAAKIVQHFGKDAMDIIKNNPERLREIKGVREKKMAALTKGLEDREKFKPLQDLLPSLSNNRLEKIYNHEGYGDKAVELIKENPYRLCSDVKGIGFMIADGIARDVGIVGNDPFRLKAAITYTLKEEAAAHGHLFLKDSEMAPIVRKYLKKSYVDGEISDLDIVCAVNAGIDEKRYVRSGSEVYLIEYHKAEVYSAEKLRKIKAGKLNDVTNVAKIITGLEKQFKITYAPKQIEAITQALQNQLLVITGGPGTGKTTIIRGIISAYESLHPGYRIKVCAPTGRAAKRITETSGFEASTIHRLIELGYSNESDKVFAKRNEENPLEADLIVVDESSMIDMILLQSFLKAVPKGCKLIFVGDADQLPSVGAGNVFSDMIKSKLVPTVMLNEIFRQADTSRIIINAHKINTGEAHLDWGPDFLIIEEEDEETAKKIIGKQVVDAIRAANGDMDAVQVLSPLRVRTETGVNTLNNYLQSLINPATVVNQLAVTFGQIQFRINDRVIQMKNNVPKDIYNGDMGVIKSIVKDETGSILATIRFGDRDVEFERADFENLDLAYATTIHKSQGSEFPIVIIPISKSHSYFLQRNTLYTGVTRAKKKVILVGKKTHLYSAASKNAAEKRNTNLVKKLDEGLD